MRARTSSGAKRVIQQTLDRRRIERRPAEGEVVLCLEQLEPILIWGELRDVSSDGFRVRHQHMALCTGQQVSFHHADAEGLAEVVWNRVLGDRVESGFVILKMFAT